MVGQKRNRLVMFAVVFGYLTAYRFILTFVSTCVLAMYAFHFGLHSSLAIKEHFKADYGLDLVVVISGLTWSGRIAIVVMARKGMLPGTGFPGDEGEYSSVFGDNSKLTQSHPKPTPARRIVPDEPPAPARKVFGTRGTTAASG